MCLSTYVLKAGYNIYIYIYIYIYIIQEKQREDAKNTTIGKNAAEMEKRRAEKTKKKREEMMKKAMENKKKRQRAQIDVRARKLQF